MKDNNNSLQQDIYNNKFHLDLRCQIKLKRFCMTHFSQSISQSITYCKPLSNVYVFNVHFVTVLCVLFIYFVCFHNFDEINL